MQNAGSGCGPGGCFRHSVNAGLHTLGHGFGCLFGAGGPSNPPDVLQNIADVLGVQRKDLGLLGKVNARLGYLPRRDGSNLANGLSQQQVRLSGFQHLMIDIVNAQALC